MGRDVQSPAAHTAGCPSTRPCCVDGEEPAGVRRDARDPRADGHRQRDDAIGSRDGVAADEGDPPVVEQACHECRGALSEELERALFVADDRHLHGVEAHLVDPFGGLQSQLVQGKGPGRTGWGGEDQLAHVATLDVLDEAVHALDRVGAVEGQAARNGAVLPGAYRDQERVVADLLPVARVRDSLVAVDAFEPIVRDVDPGRGEARVRITPDGGARERLDDAQRPIDVLLSQG